VFVVSRVCGYSFEGRRRATRPPERDLRYARTVRPLSISAGPRKRPGEEEAYVIRIEVRLKRFHRSSTPSAQDRDTAPDRDTSPDRLATSIEETWDFAERLTTRLRPRLLDAQKKSDELQAKAKHKVQHLSAIPAHQRKNGLTDTSFLISGKASLAADLHTKLDNAAADGLDRMRKRKPVMRVAFTDSELDELGLSVKDGELVGDIDKDTFASTVRARMTTVDLVRKRGMENPSPETLIMRYLVDPRTPAGRATKSTAHHLPWLARWWPGKDDDRP
jgi:hypothetical protein